ncbi:MAG: hypothetical protein AAF840_01825, partial [Bacteroidota bacterium]
MHITPIFCLLLLLVCTSCQAQPATHLSVSAPTIEQEATSIWRTLNDLQFLEGLGYTIHLPQQEIIDSLKAKSKQGQFGNDDFPTIYNLLETEEYSESAYKAALTKVEAQRELLQTLLQRLRAARQTWSWDFEMADAYEVTFTRYGTGGSYDPDHQRITLFTNSEGAFKRYKQPANTIIHEIVHLGVENTLVQRYKLSHPMKERLVDTIVYLLFNDLLPNYKIQNMGETRLDEFIKQQEDLVELEQ